jgi:hypothetical protein
MLLDEILMEDELSERGFLSKVYDKALSKIDPNGKVGAKAAGRLELDKFVKQITKNYGIYLGKIGSDGSYKDLYAFLTNIVKFNDDSHEISTYLLSKNIRVPFAQYKQNIKNAKITVKSPVPYSDKVVKDIFYLMGQYAYENDLIDDG